MGVVKNTGILLISETIAKGIAFLLIPLYSYVIDPKDFGKIAILQLVFTGFFLIVSFSLKSTFDKFFFDNINTSTKTLFSNVFALQGIAIVVGGFTYLLLKTIIVGLLEINHPVYLDIVMITAVCAVFFPIFNSYFICVGKVKKVGFYSIVISLTRSVLALMLVLKMEDKILAVLAANFMEHLLGFIISLPTYVKNTRLNLIKFKKIRELGVYSVHYFPTILSNFVIKFSDRFMIQYMLGYQSLGVYSMGTRLVNIPGQFISTINKNFTPQIYQSLQEVNGLKFNQLVRYFLVALFILLFSLILFSKEIFLLIGPEYKKAFVVFIFLCFSSYLNGYSLLIQPVMTYFKEYVKRKSIIFMSVGAMNIILNLLFIPEYGINGAALATIFSYLVAIPFNYFYTIKAFSANYYIQWFFLSCIILLLSGLYMIFGHSQFSWIEFTLRMFLFLMTVYFFISKLVNLKDLIHKFSRNF
ncbi:oligosaccharide flippase family protein [Maribacter sp. 2210JD10-5]|uniref:oligosaccharide flippase family protein n=1 Tax=Maribacter sp. 2210JD10-5 TaxID=3386272 RepID=UPI0039BCBD0C